MKLELDATRRATGSREKGYDPDFGARPMARVIQTELKDRIVDDLLFGALAKGGRVRVDAGRRTGCSSRPARADRARFASHGAGLRRRLPPAGRWPRGPGAGPRGSNRAGGLPIRRAPEEHSAWRTPTS